MSKYNLHSKYQAVFIITKCTANSAPQKYAADGGFAKVSDVFNREIAAYSLGRRANGK